jgi:hypothetical protein
MARAWRYEAAGAVYPVMARGDGGKNVFDDDKDRFGWTDLEVADVLGAAAGAFTLKRVHRRLK